MQAMVLSIIGKDKPGLVDEVAQAVANAQGNWLKSSFCQLAGHFAGFVEVSLPKAQHNKLVSDCHALSSLQITLLPANEFLSEDENRFLVKVTGNDRQGIVKDVTGALKTFNANIAKLDTHCEGAPNWGIPMFNASMDVTVPEGIDADKLQTAIESIADDLMVDITKNNSEQR